MAERRGRVEPTQWGDLTKRVKDIIIPEFHHVHICNAAAENRECEYDWAPHKLDDGGQCDCFPKIDFSQVLEEKGTTQIVFVVHNGVC